MLITLAGTLIITPDSLLVILIAADQWTIVFWRGLLSGFSILLALALYHGAEFWPRFKAIGRMGLLLSLLFSAGTISFVASLHHTTAANTLFIVSTAPVFAAVMAHLFLNETVSRRTWMTIACTLVGILIIAMGSVGGGPGSLVGDLAALLTAVFVAATFTIARRFRAVSMVPAMGLSGLVTAVLALPLAQPFAISPNDAGYLAIMGLLVIPLSFSLLTLGPRYLPAPEVSLILLLEAVLAPLLIWLVLKQYPGSASIVGGTVVITALLIANVANRRQALAAYRGAGKS